eukprot:COSAG05_NODE_1808_length_4041_cov_7733.319127_5_plen_178_part_00
MTLCSDALRKAKACGADGVPAEAFQEDGPLRAELFRLVGRIWREETVPESMVAGLFVMLYKGKGKTDDRTKYRCICLLNHAYKLLSAVLLRRLVVDCDDWLPESQAGFRKARGCPGGNPEIAQTKMVGARAANAGNEADPQGNAEARGALRRGHYPGGRDGSGARVVGGASRAGWQP